MIAARRNGDKLAGLVQEIQNQGGNSEYYSWGYWLNGCANQFHFITRNTEFLYSIATSIQLTDWLVAWLIDTLCVKTPSFIYQPTKLPVLKLVWYSFYPQDCVGWAKLFISVYADGELRIWVCAYTALITPGFCEHFVFARMKRGWFGGLCVKNGHNNGWRATGAKWRSQIYL